MRERLSVTVITKNEEKRIAKCLESIAFADEVLVVDSGSTDRTVEIARQHGARVIQQAWLGYGRQKQFAVDQAKNDWVLSLDADEWLSEGLARSIQRELIKPSWGAYKMARRNKFMGRWLRHGDGYPDVSLRFFSRKKAGWCDHPVHEKVLAMEPVGFLAGDLMHESEDGLFQYIEKQKKYARILAEQSVKKWRARDSIKIVTSPLVRFIRLYFVRLGILDGWAGFVHALASSFASYYKYYSILYFVLRSNTLKYR
jgi:glycosyltransferase involved in cell wall biosynthesis